MSLQVIQCLGLETPLKGDNGAVQGHTAAGQISFHSRREGENKQEETERKRHLLWRGSTDFMVPEIFHLTALHLL